MRGAFKWLFSFVLRIFFRRIEVVGLEKIPSVGGVMFVVNHPNALIDPLFLLCFSPRPPSFLAKAPLFKMPIVGAVVRAFDSIPVYRRQDEGSNPAQNQETFQTARAILQRGGVIAIFPEGTSHSDPKLKPLKTGAARIALSSAPLQMVPTGLFYSAKGDFRSEALLHFGEPFFIPETILDADGEPSRKVVEQLTAQIEKKLAEVTLQVNEREALDLLQKAEAIFSSHQERTLFESVDQRKKFAEAYRALLNDHPKELQALVDRVRRYGYWMEKLGIDKPTNSSKAADTLSTIKVVAGLLVFPLAWGLLVYFVSIHFLWIAPLLGYIVVIFWDLWPHVVSAVRALLLFLFRRPAFVRLEIERNRIRSEIQKLMALTN